MRSWSGPVETDFQGRPRFSYDNRPVHDGTKGFVTEINLVCLRFMSSLTRHIPARSVAAVARMRRHPTITRRGGRCMCSVRARYSQASRERRQNARMRPQGWRRQSAARAFASLCYTCATHSISATLTKQSGQCMCRVPYSQSSRDWRQNMPDTPYLCEDRVCTICLEQCDKPFTAKCGHALCNECVTELARNETHVGREPCCPMCRAHLQFKGLAQVELARGIVIKHFKPRVFVKKRKWHWTSSVCKKQCWL